MARLKHLVVIVPGILGSVLHDRDGTAVWGDLRSGVKTACDPELLDIARPLQAVGLMPTLTVIPPFRVPGYDRLISQIRNTFENVKVATLSMEKGRDPQANVLLFPYDFRWGVEAAAEVLAAEIRDRLGPPGEARRKVVVIGHSMGGLVARYWLGPLGGAPYCRSLITVGTPHRGAPKALDWLWNGVGTGRIRYGRATRILRGWPAAYDLLPRYRAVLAGKARTGPSLGDDPAARYPRELDWPDATAARHAARAHQLHDDLERSWADLAEAAPNVLPIFARGHGTPARSTLLDGRLLVAKEDAEWLPNQGWLGDGTVPSYSAIPWELGGEQTRWRAVPERHLPMASSPAIVEALRNLSSDSLDRVRGDAPGSPWLGLDLPGTVPARTPVTVRARLLGTAADERTVLEVKLAGIGTLRGEPVGEGVWEVTLPPLEPGAHPVKVVAQAPGGNPVSVQDVIGALEEEPEL
ncbi:hypothetical protein GCM10027589_45770 [Actinocorallia lasiicapitis]